MRPEGQSSSVLAPLHSSRLRARRLGLDTQYEAIVFMRPECSVCRAEGFTAHSRVLLASDHRGVIATLYHSTNDGISTDEVGLSDSAWKRLNLQDGDFVDVSHPPLLESLSHLRKRIYGNDLDEASLHTIVADVVNGQYADIHLASFITACSARPLTQSETLALTRAMVEVGERIKWDTPVVADKHSVGGLPGNRTTPIVVAIVSSLGLTIPKTSSRAITSPAGTADTMETLAPVDLDLQAIRRVVSREGGCIVWGGAIRLSPADDILIRVERALDLDPVGQLIASVLSKKIAAGATHVVLDLPVGPTAKVRTKEAADLLSAGLADVAGAFGLTTKTILSDGTQPVGHGIGPALEARDVLAVLQRHQSGPTDLRERSIRIAGQILEIGGIAAENHGTAIARDALDEGRAWIKFQDICEAQGGMRQPPRSRQHSPILAAKDGIVRAIDNRKIAKLAKLSGAPNVKAAGVDLHVKTGDVVFSEQPLCTVHADAPGELSYALNYAAQNPDFILVSQS